jgi:hypothetical protein
MKILKILVFFLLPSLAWAKLDYSSQNFIRSYPFGLFFSGTFGYAFKLWDKSDINPALYGYVRPSATLQNSGPVNQVRGQIDVAPIAFTNFYAGTALVNRDFNDLDTFDCDTLICRAKMVRQYVGAKMALKYKDVFFLMDHRFERVKISEKRGAFAEEMGTLVGAGGNDVLRVNQFILGYEFAPDWAFGGLLLLNAMEKVVNSSRMQMGFVRHQHKKWNILWGVGSFHTRTNSDVLSTMVLVQWSGEKGLTLF